MKATITRETLNKLYMISHLTKIMFFERNVRISAFTRTFKYGTVLKELEDGFKIPIIDLPLFINMIESVMGKSNKVDIEYNVIEKDFGLESKQLYNVNITNCENDETKANDSEQTKANGPEQSFMFYTSENIEFKEIIPNDLGDKSHISTMTLPPSYMKFKLTSEMLKMMDKNCKILSADTILFKETNDKKPIKCKIYNNENPDGAISEFKIYEKDTRDATQFPLLVDTFNVIDKSIDYDVLINCDKNAILFANEESSTFYISAAKKTDD